MKPVKHFALAALTVAALLLPVGDTPAVRLGRRPAL